MTLFELRSYVAHSGRRDELIGMFETIFLDAYQAGGARIVGTFRSLDEPDRWVWMRAFPDAASRGPALENFYGGDVWKRNADACNATSAPTEEATVPQCMYELAVYRELPARFSGVALVTDLSENSYPRQPVRTESLYVTLTQFASTAARSESAPLELMRLVPTARSALR